VDAYTYDLLHIAIYPYCDQDSAHAFLLALRAKGYHPRVIVTDLRVDYSGVIARVFPHAQHHECIFHALQNVQDYCKEVYGAGYAETHPEAEALKQAIYHIFDARTRRTAEKRYAEVMAQRERYVQETPQAAVLFDFLERHWPKLVNGIESDLIPRTNNTVELVIRRFDQHYQNFCGFDTLETAQLFLGSSRRCTASRPSRRTPNLGCGVSAPWSWPAMTSARCRWLRSAPASAWTGRWRWPRTLSQTRDGHRGCLP